MEKGKIIIVSGWRMIGKTTFCKSVIDQARDKGFSVCGLLSLARFNDGKKVGIDVQDLSTQEIFPLAEFNQGQESSIKTRAWVFDQERVSWGNQVLKNISPCDLLVIDELGPIEFYRQKGWTAGFDALDTHCYKLALVVIRPELIDEAKQKWPDTDIIQINSIDEIPERTEVLLNSYL